MSKVVVIEHKANYYLARICLKLLLKNTKQIITIPVFDY